MAFLRPDVLVLGAGGVVGEAWMSGVLAGVEAAAGLDLREVEALVGTSAGAIVAASLAAGRRPRAPAGDARAHQSEPAPHRQGVSPLALLARSAGTLGAPLAPLALAVGSPGGALARRALLSRAPRDGRSLDALRREVASWGARFDGRLRVCALDRASGRRVVFGAPGAPGAMVADAVEASCAVPWVFRPVTIGGRVYVDGGVWSPTNLDAAPAGRGSHVLCLTVAGGRPRGSGSPAGWLRAAARPAVALEASALRRRGAAVRVVAPADDLGADLLDRRGADAALAAGYRQGLALGAG